MTRTTLNPQTDLQLNRAVIASIGFHAVLFVLFAVRMALTPADDLLMENTIRVDIVGLPEKSVTLPPPLEAPAEPEAQPKPETKPEPEPEPAKPVEAKSEKPKVNLEKTKRDQAAALKRLEALEKLRQQSAAKPAARESAAKTPNAQAPVRGNAINAGNSLTGLAKVDNENFRALVKDQVTRRWNLPQWLSSANLSAVVRLFIDERGNLTKKELVRASGNEVFDESVLRAIESATPFPKPPNGLVDQISVFGIAIEFKPTER